MKRNIYLLVLLMFIGISCKTKKQSSDLNYMQNIEKVAIESVKNQTTTTLQVGDQLVIVISGRDKDVLSPFNQNYASSDAIINAANAGNLITKQERVTGPTYNVGTNGIIDFPVIGELYVQNKTIDELREVIKLKMKRYVKSPVSVNIQLVNFEVSVFGEVKRANKYRMNGLKKPTVLDAIALAGDLTMYGKRDDVLVYRNENGVVSQGRINLKDANFINSPYYYLKQGDAIIVSANENKERQAKINPNRGVYIQIVSVALTAIGLIYAMTK